MSPVVSTNEPVTRSRSDIEGREGLNDFHGFKADRDYTQEQLQWIAWVTHGFGGPVVGVVGDATVFVGADALAFYDPIQRGLAVDDVVVSLQRDAGDGDLGVVVQGAEVFVLALFAVLHLGYAVVTVAAGAALQVGGVHGHGFITQVHISQGTACFGVGPEVSSGFYRRYMRQLFAEVIGVLVAVFRRMQQALDVIEQVFLADDLAWIGSAKVR